MPTIKVSPEVLQSIVTMRGEGLSVAAIARRHDLCWLTTQRALERWEHEQFHATAALEGTSISDDTRKALTKAMRPGLTQADKIALARKFGVSMGHVDAVYRGRSWYSRRAKRHFIPSLGKIMKASEIAKHVGVRKGTIDARLARGLEGDALLQPPRGKQGDINGNG